MPVALTAPVRLAATGEVTTIAALAAAGRVRFTTGTHTGRKVRGERTAVTHYRAELIPEKNDGQEGFWPISRAAYLSRTGRDVGAALTEPPPPAPRPAPHVATDTGTPWLS
jgi:hypothetical protein